MVVVEELAVDVQAVYSTTPAINLRKRFNSLSVIWSQICRGKRKIVHYIVLVYNIHAYLGLKSASYTQILRVQMALSRSKHMCSVLFAFTWRPMPHAACPRLCNRNSTSVGVFVRSASKILAVIVETYFC